MNCVYVDVDRRYYHSNLGLPVSQHYAEIDVQPGYQRLCGQNALDYVRFRHNDNDIVRAARQQDFLRQAAAQISTSRLIRNLDPLVRAFAKSTSTDGNLQTGRGILRLLRLAASSAGRPVRQIRFPATFIHTPAPATTVTPFGTVAAAPGLGDYVTATPEQVQRAVDQFLRPRTPPSAHAAARQAEAEGEAPRPRQRRRLQARHRARGGKGDRPPGARPSPLRAARLRARLAHAARALPAEHGRRPLAAALRDHRPRRRAPPGVPAGGRGGRDGGPVLRHPGHQLAQPADPQRQARQTVRMAGRTYRVYYDGAHVLRVARVTRRGAYWGSNTLSRDLSGCQMLGIARSLTRIPR